MISVVIPTRDRSGDLEQVLPTYLSQQHVAEVIIVDDSTKDPHPRRIREMVRRDPRLILI